MVKVVEIESRLVAAIAGEGKLDSQAQSLSLHLSQGLHVQRYATNLKV